MTLEKFRRKMESNKICKYCKLELELCVSEGLDCVVCEQSVHLKCLDQGTPGGLEGDVFFTYTCRECSPHKEEVFLRKRISWMLILILVFYHMQRRNSGLARRGYFHWRNHITCFVESHWDYLFTKDVKKKKNLQGTIAGILSHFSTMFFQSGTAIFNEPAWWTLTYPKLTPNTVSNLYSIFTTEKSKLKQENATVNITELFQKILSENIHDENLLTRFMLLDPPSANESRVIEDFSLTQLSLNSSPSQHNIVSHKRKHALPPSSSPATKISKGTIPGDNCLVDTSTSMKKTESKSSCTSDISCSSSSSSSISNPENLVPKRNLYSGNKNHTFLDPLCHYNTSLSSLSRAKSVSLQVKLLGGVRQGMILSPYSGIHLKPYIWRDIETFPPWLKLMAQLQLKSNCHRKNYVLPPRSSIDYMLVQPEHIPAINSLCNQFFWTGIDLTESIRYPEFSCVVMYKRLVIGFAFIVPNVSHTENYLSFIFTRPNWRNVGIAKRMLYFLIQTSLNKDITLHVSVNNSALFLYQKFGFKVERIDKDFYEKYLTHTDESKNAFFCRLERFHS